MNKKLILLPLLAALLLTGLANAVWVTNSMTGQQIWENSTQLFNVTSGQNPIGAIGQVINTGLPFFWPLFNIVLYLWMWMVYADAPSGGRLYMICALVFVISVFLALAGSISTAVINFMIFAIVFFLANQFKHV